VKLSEVGAASVSQSS